MALALHKVMAPSTGTRRTAADKPDSIPTGSRAARTSINRSETPAFSCASDGTILNWNSAAERIFGIGATEARQRKCWEVVAGLDVFGNDYCSRQCPIREMARRGRDIKTFRMTVRDAAGYGFRVRTMVMVLRNGGRQHELVHLLDPLAPASSTRHRQLL